MWNQNNNGPPIPFRPGAPTNQGGHGRMPAPSGFGIPPGGFGHQQNAFGRPAQQQNMGMPAPNMTNMSNFGIMTYGVSQNMQAQYIQHISKLEPLIIQEMKKSKYRGSITNMAKLLPPKRELTIVIDTTLDITG
jgi:hypothetical protein